VLAKKRNFNLRNILGRFPWFALLFGAYPTLALLGHNIDQVSITAGYRPLVVSEIGTSILVLILRWVFHNWQKAAIATSLSLLIIFSYGHVYSLLKETSVFGIALGRHRLLAPIWLGMLALGLWGVSRISIDLKRITTGLNWVSILLLVFPSLQLVFHTIKVQTATTKWQDTYQQFAGFYVLPGRMPPDIYYIILDMYGRADTLRNLYGYDNTAFLNELEKMGFYVANCSQSNYFQTELSLASSLNFNYLDALGFSYKPDSTDRSPLWPLIKDSAIRRIMEGLGYKIVAFATGYSWTEWDDADIYLKPPQAGVNVTEFEQMLIETSAVRILQDAAILSRGDLGPDPYRERTSYVLKELKQLPTLHSPKFVFVHLILPHPPFVFGPNGEAIEPIYFQPSDSFDIFIKGYRDQLIFTDREVLQVVSRIISDSPVPPIIIIQGDHGPGLSADLPRSSILNAYYLPGADYNVLYPHISPVNTFRVVLNDYFGGNLELLNDVSLASNYSTPYQYTILEDSCP
jgi:hypothetical protein